MFNKRNQVEDEGTVSVIDKNHGLQNEFVLNNVQPQKVKSAADECKI